MAQTGLDGIANVAREGQVVQRAEDKFAQGYERGRAETVRILLVLNQAKLHGIARVQEDDVPPKAVRPHVKTSQNIHAK